MKDGLRYIYMLSVHSVCECVYVSARFRCADVFNGAKRHVKSNKIAEEMTPEN